MRRVWSRNLKNIEALTSRWAAALQGKIYIVILVTVVWVEGWFSVWHLPFVPFGQALSCSSVELSFPVPSSDAQVAAGRQPATLCARPVCCLLLSCIVWLHTELLTQRSCRIERGSAVFCQYSDRYRHALWIVGSGDSSTQSASGHYLWVLVILTPETQRPYPLNGGESVDLWVRLDFLEVRKFLVVDRTRNCLIRQSQACWLCCLR